MILVFFIAIGLLIISGLPIFVVLGLTATIMLVFFTPVPVLMIPEIFYNALAGFALVAIPLFAITAQFMLRGGISRHMLNVANSLVGHWRGGLAVTVVVACILIAAMCGSSVATAMAVGIIIVPAMQEMGYSASFSTGVVAASGTIGIMIPPSISLIVYGILTEQSVPRLFLGGVFPGLLEGLLYILWILFYSKRKGYRGSEKATPMEVLKVSLKALPAFSLPVIIMGGIYSGIVTVTEAAALAAVVSMVLAIFVYREVKLRQIFSVTADGIRLAGMVLLILASAVVFGHWITHAGIAAKVVLFVRELGVPPLGFLLFCNILYLCLGCFLEGTAMLLITIPILFPVICELGIDPIHFGILVVVNIEVAAITPPVGLNLFVLSGSSNVPVDQVLRGAFPFVFLGLIEVAILTYWPWFSTFLPNLLM